MSSAVDDRPCELPVTPVQRALIVSSLSGPPGTDHVHVTVRTPDSVAESPLRAAWERLLRRHPLLAGAALVDGTQVRLAAQAAPDLDYRRVADGGAARALADQLLGAARTRQLVLGQPLSGLACVTADGWGAELLLSFHHALVDGRSLVTILDDLLGDYDSLAAGRTPPLSPGAAWADFAAALATRSADDDYWRLHLAGAQPAAAFVRPGDDVAQADPVCLVTWLSHRDTDALTAAADRYAVGFGTLVQTAWSLVLAARTDAPDVLFGATLSTRWGSIPDVDELVGPGLNTAAVRVRIDPAEPLGALVSRVHATLRSHRDRLAIPLGENLARAAAGHLLPLPDSIVMIDRANIERRLHRRRPTWRRATVTLHRHVPVAVGLWGFDERPARLELMTDARTTTGTAAGELLSGTVEALQLLADSPDVTVGAAVTTLAGRASELTLAPSLAELPAITRVDRSAYAISTPDELPDHLVALGTDWGLWRDLIVRSTAVEFDALDTLADPELAALADAAVADPGALAAVIGELPAAGRRLNAALHRLGRDPRIREAIAWQNRGALRTGIDSLLRRDPDTLRRNTKHRQHEALLGSYAQRYAAKNDTIGFFGPLGWGRLVPGGEVGIVHGPAPLAARTTYLESWALNALMEPWNEELRPDLAPVRRPHIGLDKAGIRVPNGEPVALTPGERAVLQACDGTAPARVLAADLAGTDPALPEANSVLHVLARARQRGWIAWGLMVHPDDAHGEQTLRRRLVELPDSTPARGALAALDAIVSARDDLAAAAGDPDAVTAAAEALDTTFTELSGQAAIRRAGALYAGRTVAYEDCRLGTDVTIGTDLLAAVSPGLQAVLCGARWYATAAGRLLEHLVRGYHEEHAGVPGQPVPLADIWALIVDVVSEESEELIGPVARGLAERWTRVLQLPDDPADGVVREIRLDGREVLERAQAEFAIDHEGWQGARQHGPDVMLLGGDDGRPVGWVLGEIHPGVNCLRYRTWVEHHDDPQSLRRAMRADVGEPAIWQAATGALRGMPTRLTNALAGDDDLWLACATDALGPDWDRTLRLGDLDLLAEPDAMWFADRRTGRRVRFLDAISDLLTGSIVQGYGVRARASAYSPRVWIDSLVISRERWSFPVSDLAFATEPDEAKRFVAFRSWAARHAMPRRLFMTTTGEKKPVYVDRDSLVSTDLLARAVRRAAGRDDPTATITLSEMLPAPEHLWLRDAAGRRHTAELRLVATDRTGSRA